MKNDILIKIEQLKTVDSISDKYNIIYSECIKTLGSAYPSNINKESIKNIFEYATIISLAKNLKEFNLITSDHFDNRYINIKNLNIFEINKNNFKTFVFTYLLFFVSVYKGHERNFVLNILSAENIGNYEVLNFLIDNNIIGGLGKLCILEMYPDWYELYNIYRGSNKKQTWEYNNLAESNTIKEKHMSVRNILGKNTEKNLIIKKEETKKTFRILKI
jgi:hypothetical protein